MRIVKIAAPLAILLVVAACEQGPKQTGGTLVGAGAGALASSQIGSGKGNLAAMAIGTLLGAVAGSEVGKSLDRADRSYAERTAQQSLETARVGQPVTWGNPDTGNTGGVTPTRTYQTTSGQHCREYQQTVTVAGKTENGYGTVCRQPDGSWKIMN